MNTRVLLVSVFILIFVYTVNGEVSNNTSHIYDNNSSLKNDSYNRTPYTFRVLVDGYHGFYRAYNIGTGEELIGRDDNKTLNIYIGDTVIWSNEDPVEIFTIESDPKLWANNVGYLGPGKRFSYTFNQSGMYTIDVKKRITSPHQIIIVNSPALTPNKTIIEKDTIENVTIYNQKDNQKKDNQKDNQSVSDTKGTKSKITIKIYRRPKKTSGFEGIIIIPIIMIIYMLRQKRLETKKVVKYEKRGEK